MPAEQLKIEATWTIERVERLKERFQAGLTCREIALELGVSRNAVIGKVSRLMLTRDDRYGKRRRQRNAAPKPARKRHPPLLRRQVLKQLLKATSAPPILVIEPCATAEARGCSLLELTKERCRWPLSTPGAADFCFCGNTPLDSLPYCAGHARLAYRVTSCAQRSDGGPTSADRRRPRSDMRSRNVTPKR
ncbi:conserved hypothetical protein [Bradyrhizobium sp. STM 3843]|uniref:GcrA family cell cycle regulator n=1 Tax=Bradyrhizobium sp. STM 3843 TaxID=551947 RepID=UPI0002405305|nr:conserved hypothetical protein [Bradyrhizobium sp. STM 3843]